MQLLVCMLAAIVAGILISTQPALNAILARSIGSATSAATVSIAVALVFMILLTLFGDRGELTFQKLLNVPWWVYLAGVVGAVFVAAGVMIAPVTGALVFFVCVVAGQLIGATLADHFGAFGLDIRPMSLLRAIGICLAIAGAVLVGRG